MTREANMGADRDFWLDLGMAVVGRWVEGAERREWAAKFEVEPRELEQLERKLGELRAITGDAPLMGTDSDAREAAREFGWLLRERAQSIRETSQLLAQHPDLRAYLAQHGGRFILTALPFLRRALEYAEAAAAALARPVETPSPAVRPRETPREFRERHLNAALEAVQHYQQACAQVDELGLPEDLATRVKTHIDGKFLPNRNGGSDDDATQF
jgi:hypothetical protein